MKKNRNTAVNSVHGLGRWTYLDSPEYWAKVQKIQRMCHIVLIYDCHATGLPCVFVSCFYHIHTLQIPSAFPYCYPRRCEYISGFHICMIDSQMPIPLHGLMPGVFAALLWTFIKECGQWYINIPFPLWDITNLQFIRTDKNKFFLFVCFGQQMITSVSVMCSCRLEPIGVWFSIIDTNFSFQGLK